MSIRWESTALKNAKNLSKYLDIWLFILYNGFVPKIKGDCTFAVQSLSIYKEMKMEENISWIER